MANDHGKESEGKPEQSLTGSAAYSLRVALEAFIRSLKLLACELSTDVGPFTKSPNSFAQIGVKVLQQLQRNLEVLESLQIEGHVQEFDGHLTGVTALCRHFADEVIQPLAAVDQEDEGRAAAQMGKIGGAVSEILRNATLELDSLSRRMELIAVIGPEYDKPVRKAVVSLDLWRYGELVRLVDAAGGIAGVAGLNQQIETLIRHGVKAVGDPAGDALTLIVGDGATLLFDSPQQAYTFAESVHRQTEHENATNTPAGQRKHFRVGISLGDVAVRKVIISDKFVALNVLGPIIINAVRLQEACKPGEVLICYKAFDELPDDLKAQFGPREDVQGKHPGEIIPAHRRQIVPPPPA